MITEPASLAIPHILSKSINDIKNQLEPINDKKRAIKA